MLSTRQLTQALRCSCTKSPTGPWRSLAICNREGEEPGTRFLQGKLVCPDRQLLFRWDLGNGSQQALLRNAGKQ